MACLAQIDNYLYRVGGNQNKKSIWKSEINLEIRNQVKNHGDLKPYMLFSKMSYPSHRKI